MAAIKKSIEEYLAALAVEGKADKTNLFITPAFAALPTGAPAR